MSRPIRILQLYPRDMNIYGDWGNTLTLQRRAEWRGLPVEIISYNPGDSFPTDIDLIVGGGGQDSGQSAVQNDLLAIGPHLQQLTDDDVPMLMICGLYQLFGHFFRTKDGETIQGIGLLDVETVGGPERLIGNIVTESSEFGQIIGYENHSGLTTLGAHATQLGTLIKGAGNNGQDNHEGARYRNVIGTYLHGSLLPKNPQIADWLLEKAALHASITTPLAPLDDELSALTDRARAVATHRPR